MRTLIKNGVIVTAEKSFKGCVAFTDGIIDYVGKDPVEADEIIDAEWGYVVPGFIDIHCHGGNNLEFMDAGVEGFGKIAEFHKSHGKLATLTVVNAGQRFGVIQMNKDDKQNTSFREKRDSDGNPINGGFMVLDPKVIDYIDGDETVFEKKPLENLAKDQQLMGFHHDGFWQCMDTKKDWETLEKLWESGEAPWLNWEE